MEIKCQVFHRSVAYIPSGECYIIGKTALPVTAIKIIGNFTAHHHLREQQFTKAGLLNLKAMNAAAANALEKIGVEGVNPAQPVNFRS